MIAPPSLVISTAVLAASRSPCAKSKRGAVLMWVGEEPGREMVPMAMTSSAACNGPPEPWICDGSTDCKAACGVLCMHAEARCLRQAAVAGLRRLEPNAFTAQMRGNSENYELVHIKAIPTRDDAIGVPGGPPSCIQCSKAILDFGLRGVWLYEKLLSGGGQWRRYTPFEFHHATIENLSRKDPSLVAALARRR